MTTSQETRQDIHTAYSEEYAENIRKEWKWLRYAEKLSRLPSLFEVVGVVGGFGVVAVVYPAATVIAVPMMTLAVGVALARTIPPAIARRLIKRKTTKAIDADIDNSTLTNRFENDLKKDTLQIEQSIADIEKALADLKLKLPFTSASSGIKHSEETPAPPAAKQAPGVGGQ